MTPNLLSLQSSNSDTRVLVRDPTILDDLDLTVQIFLEFCEPGVHDAATPNLLSLQSPNSDMGIHV